MDVKRRILVSISAWLAGAVVATSGTLVAISWIGQGISTSSVRTLSVDEVTSALAGMSPSPVGSADGPTDGAAGSASPSASPTPSVPRGQSPSASAVATTSPPRTLVSSGGSVIAVCSAAGAYLTSWSPAENFQVDDVRRGPARVAGVEFRFGLTQVELAVVCHNGVPTVLSPETQSRGPDT